MLEEILSRENMTQALRRVQSNKGTSGIDGMSVDELQPYLMPHWAFIKAEILEGTYKPSAVKEVEIPKPERKQAKAWDTNGTRPVNPAGNIPEADTDI